MGSGVSCCCGGKSVDVIATNTDARPWMKDEATGPDDETSSSTESLTPAVRTDTTVKQHPRGPMPERRGGRLRHSKSLTSSQFPNLPNLLDHGNTTKKSRGVRYDHSAQQAPRNNAFNGKNTTRDHKVDYNTSALRTPKHVAAPGASPSAAGGLSFSRYHACPDTGSALAEPQQRLTQQPAPPDTDGQAHRPTTPPNTGGHTHRLTTPPNTGGYTHGLRTPPNTGGYTHRLTTPPNTSGRTHQLSTPGRGVRDSASDQHDRRDVNGANKSRDDVAGGSHLDIRGQAATLYSKNGSLMGLVNVANSSYPSDEASSKSTGSTESEMGSSGSDETVEKRRNMYKKAEGFFLPIDSLVPPTPKKKIKKNKKKGTAFVITFNDSGIESASIEGDDGDNTPSEDESETTTHGPAAARNIHQLSDLTESSSDHVNWAVNQRQNTSHISSSSQHLEPTSGNRSKQFIVGGHTPNRSSKAGPTASRGLRTPVPVKNIEGDFGADPYGSVGQQSGSNYLRQSGSDPVSRVRGSYQAYQQARRLRSTDGKPQHSVDTSGTTTAAVGGSDTRRRAAPLADVSAYLRRSSQRPSVETRRLDAAAMKRHIDDLRFLLSHRLSQQTRTAGMTTRSNVRSKFSDALIKSCQEEIARLETDLQRTESKLTQTTSGYNCQVHLVAQHSALR
ncbi:hypothetical protein NP493_155g01019 [Ridgeia piscesae]|uniref:Uncharacterized protein n=1 Tax=Ridgeia piscesae TaxID=27915 RepID=A0AAD9P421_RIDPI|nr:hypothetical protein NP493_155g01019 [Ridgeia piscesae]